MDKQNLVAQLMAQLRELAATATTASAEAAHEAVNGATPSEKREDARVALEYAGLARGQARRAQRAFGELAALEGFRPTQLGRGAAAQLGAIVEMEDEDSGEGRTFFLAPAGAGVRLTGPGGDGYLSVVTPNSPVGRAVMGRRVGDVIDVSVDQTVREWAITWIE
jgi:transcription elongation GreA/GreB family factor